jgi:outer membrane lipoprotein-sorting protein
MTPRRREILAVSAILALAPGALYAADLSADDQSQVDKAVAYLEGLANAKGRFRQTNWKGGVATGALYISRPGKARFEYDPPTPILMIADGKTVTVVNSRLKTTNRYPLNSTPLGLFLASQIRLDKSVRVTGVSRVAGGFSIIAADSHAQTRGVIRLDFAESPLRLAGWAVTDPQNRQVTVNLEGFGPVGSLPADLFEAGRG